MSDKKVMETRTYIKNVLKEIMFLNSNKESLEDIVVDRILYLIELYVAQEVSRQLDLKIGQDTTKK